MWNVLYKMPWFSLHRTYLSQDHFMRAFYTQKAFDLQWCIFLYTCVEILGWAHMTSESMDFLFTYFCAIFCGFSPWTSTIACCFLLRREIEKLLILKIRSIRRKSLLTTKVPWTKNLYFRNKASMLFEDNFCSQMKCILLVSFLVQWVLLYGNLSYSI